MKTFDKEHKRKDAVEILKLAGVLDNIDDDVYKLCIEIMPKEKEHLISMADLMEGMQDIKNKMLSEHKQKVKEAIEKVCIKSNDENLFWDWKKELLKELEL